MAKMEEAMENLLEDEAEGVLTPAEKQISGLKEGALTIKITALSLATLSI
jgi:hypothetical protein